MTYLAADALLFKLLCHLQVVAHKLSKGQQCDVCSFPHHLHKRLVSGGKADSYHVKL